PTRNILLAEDGKTNQMVAVSLLTKWGHEVTVAENGQAAIELWQTRPFDLILMDVQMPVLDGLQATQSIRRLEQASGHHTPIVAMTARALKGDRNRCLAAGMDDYISKPVRRSELYRVLCNLGSPASPGQAAVRQADETSPPPQTNPPQDGPPAIDWEQAIDKMGGDRQLLRSVLEVTLREFPRLKDDLREALHEQDAPRAQRVAHTIKGEAAAIAALATQQAAAVVEKLAAENDLAVAGRELPQLNATIDELLRHCEEYGDQHETRRG
ncbi:MAG: response regulator, partial [Planctomycetales bacterium]|nr:response regulator [Planctomycetales bacterium]